MIMAKIGVFDSGIGGLTLASELNDRLPNHSIIYFGDTAHFPYGEKSQTAIQSYSIKICNLLLEEGCDVILIACNSASVSAFDLVKAYVGSRAKVFNVIDSAVNYVCDKFLNEKVGLIGTKRTIDSDIYKQKVDLKSKGVDLVSLATPLLAPMIEEGFAKGAISESILSEYLTTASFSGIKAIILGCTHYPLIKESIDSFFKYEIEVIDSPEIVVNEVENYLKDQNLKEDAEVKHHFYISDYTESFNDSTKLFFGEQLNLKEYKLWE